MNVNVEQKKTGLEDIRLYIKQVLDLIEKENITEEEAQWVTRKPLTAFANTLILAFWNIGKQ